MNKKRLQFKKYLQWLPALAVVFFLGAPLRAQSMPSQANQPTQENDTTRRDLAQFDQFMDGHREIAEQLRKDPSLVNNKEFVGQHPALQAYLQEHPGIREEIKENPSTFMRQENRFDRHEDARDNDTTRRDLAQFGQFMDGHLEIAEQLRKDPSLINNREFVQNHPALQSYLQEHPGIREEIRENPNAFMRQENRFDRHEEARETDATRRDDENARRDNDATSRDNDNSRRDNDAMHHDNDTPRRDNDTTRKELARFDQFADSHREIAEQLRKDPSLVNNREFVQNHPALQAYLQEHPGIREEIKENPNAFMHQENRFDRHEDAGYSGATREHLASFGEFLGGHSSVAQQVSKDPSLVNNNVYVKNHPELQEYLNTHPEVRADMKQDPQSFIKSAQQFNVKNGAQAPKTTPAPTADTTKPKL